jgi:hypothetical protein
MKNIKLNCGSNGYIIVNYIFKQNNENEVNLEGSLGGPCRLQRDSRLAREGQGYSRSRS